MWEAVGSSRMDGAEHLTLAIGKEFLVLCACIQDSLQLQLTQLAVLNCRLWKTVPQGIAALREGDGPACSTNVSYRFHVLTFSAHAGSAAVCMR